MKVLGYDVVLSLLINFWVNFILKLEMGGWGEIWLFDKVVMLWGVSLSVVNCVIRDLVVDCEDGSRFVVWFVEEIWLFFCLSFIVYIGFFVCENKKYRYIENCENVYEVSFLLVLIF